MSPCPGARVFVDNTEVTGTVPMVAAGSHLVQVSAPGFVAYSATINVVAPMSLDVAMQPGLSLMVNVNVPNASISVDNVPIQGNVAFVSRGPHSLKVHVDGYLDWNGMVNVLYNMTFPVRMNPAGFPLAIRVGAPGAAIFVDGANVTGTVPAVGRGSHTIRVSAPGFQDYNSVVTVNGPLTLDVVLQSAGFLLTVNANVADATVSVNNAPKGPVPYSEYLPAGTYAVRVSADGYTDFAANIPLNKAVNLAVQLTPAVSTLTFFIPPNFRDPDMRQGDSRAQVRIFVDNKLVNPNRELDRIPIAPGRHAVRITSGAFSMQVRGSRCAAGTELRSRAVHGLEGAHLHVGTIEMRLVAAAVLLVSPLAFAGADAASVLADADSLHNQGAYPEAVKLLLDAVPSASGGEEQAELYWRAARETWSWATRRRKSGKPTEDVLAVFTDGEKYADKAIEADPRNDFAYYWKSANIGRWGQVKGVLNALFKASRHEGPAAQGVVAESRALRPLLSCSVSCTASFRAGQSLLATSTPRCPLAAKLWTCGRRRWRMARKRSSSTISPPSLQKRCTSATGRRLRARPGRRTSQPSLPRPPRRSTRRSLYEATAALADQSDREEAKSLVQRVVNELQNAPSLTAPDKKDLIKAKNVLKAW